MKKVDKILDNIHQPSDLKKLPHSQLKQLAGELREEIIQSVKTNGGHLASSLGVVELTIALHRVFDSPRDKIVWDTGHQCYAHKLLTGRHKDFHSLRQYQGLSGFPDRNESQHDAFGVGHASTSISAALGMAVARDFADEDYHVVAVIGDGAFGGGMALEGSNQAGYLGTRLIVVLNDNSMSISPTVGLISKWLSKVRVSSLYTITKKETAARVKQLPLGKRIPMQIIRWLLYPVKQAKYGLKALLLPTMMLEEIGFIYMGPFSGHNISELESAFRRAKKYPKGPVFIHILTEKGKGYQPAEEDAVSYHGVSPQGKKGDDTTYSEVVGQTILRLARENPRVAAITAAMRDSTGLDIVAREFPDRVFDVGICEEHAVTFAAGMATQGFIPIVAIYSTFLQRAFDQILHDVCLQKLPVIFAIDRSGIVGGDGKSHQGCYDLSYLSCIPNLVICAPRDEEELQQLFYTAVKAEQPIAIRYPKSSILGTGTPVNFREIPIGAGELLRDGSDMAFIAIGSTVLPSLVAAQELSHKGINCTVIDARFVKPLDSTLILETARRIKRLLVVEENTLCGGIGSAILQLLQQEGVYDARVRCLGIPDTFVGHGSQQVLRSYYHLDSQGIVEEALKFISEMERQSEYSLNSSPLFSVSTRTGIGTSPYSR